MWFIHFKTDSKRKPRKIRNAIALPCRYNYIGGSNGFAILV